MRKTLARSFLASFIPLARRYAESQQNIGVVLVEIDNLNSIREEEGEEIAQACQNEIADMLQSLAKRTDDIVGIVDEYRFAVAFANAGYEEVKQIVADFMLGFFGDELILNLDGKRKRVEAKVCAGVAAHQGSEDGFSTLEKAYRALRDAQSNAYSSFSCLERSQGAGFFDVIARQFKPGREIAEVKTLDETTGFPAAKEFENLLLAELKEAEKVDNYLSVVEISLPDNVDGDEVLADDDRVIKALAKGVSNMAKRRHDLFCRTGKRGLSLLLTNTDENASRVILSRLEKSIRGMLTNRLLASPADLSISTFVHKPGDSVETFSEIILRHVGLESQAAAS